MGIVLDILIMVLFALLIAKNYRRPQLRCGLETLCFYLSAGFSVPLSITISDICYEQLFRDALAHNLEKVLAETSKLESNISHFTRIFDKMPSVVRNAGVSYQTTTAENISEVERLVLSNSPTAGTEIVDLIAQPVIEGIFRAVLCVIFFCGMLYLFKSLFSIVENAMYTPDRFARDTVLCGVFGCFKGLVVVTLIVTVVQLVLPALPDIPFLNAQTLETSFIFKLFYHQNILMLFLGRGVYPTSL